MTTWRLRIVFTQLGEGEWVPQCWPRRSSGRPRKKNVLSMSWRNFAIRSTHRDAEALARVLGQVDISAIKREGQTDVQHPIYSPLNEQWEGFIQHLTNLKVRQAMVKTADDRLASIWAERIKLSTISDEILEKQIICILSRYQEKNKKEKMKSKVIIQNSNDILFSY